MDPRTVMELYPALRGWAATNAAANYLLDEGLDADAEAKFADSREEAVNIVVDLAMELGLDFLEPAPPSGAMRGMRILVSNQHLPGYTSETVERDPRPGVLEVRDVFDPAGRLIGQISYETRRVNRGTLYGWTAVGTGRNGFLDDQLDAIRKLIARTTSTPGRS